MKQKTKDKLRRRLHHLKEVLEACTGEHEDEPELIALYHTVRDIQPGLCEAIAEQVEGPEHIPEWSTRYRGRILSDEEQKVAGEFLWSEEEE